MDGHELLNYINVLKTYRRNFEPDWYRCYYAYENNSFISWNRQNQSLMKTPLRKQGFMNIPEVKKQADSLENLLLSFDPTFVVYPDDISDKSGRETSVALSKWLKQHYINWNTSGTIHRFVHTAIVYPISFWEISVQNRLNPVNGKVKKTIISNIADPFDYLFDPRIPFEDNQIIARIVRKSERDLKKYDGYKNVSGTSPSSAEDIKEMIYTNQYGVRGESGDLKTVIIYEVMEKTQEGIKKTVIDEKGNILDKELFEGATFYPVVPLQLSSGPIYQPSVVSNLLPISRSISRIVNRIEEFIMKFVKGSYLVREGSEVYLSDENGTVVYYEGDMPTILPQPVFQPTIILWLNTLFTIAERYGVNQQAMGMSPKGSQMRAAKMQENALKQQQQQQKTALDNLVEAFRRIANVTVYYLSEYTDEPQTMTFKNEGNDFEKQTFIGEKYSLKDPKAIKIPHSLQNLDIEIEDISTSSINSKRNTVIELAKIFNQIPDPLKKVTLDLFKVGNTADIMEDLQLNGTLLDSPEFQSLIAQARAGMLPPEVTQALATLTKFNSGQSPVPNPSQMPIQTKTQGAPLGMNGQKNGAKAAPPVKNQNTPPPSQVNQQLSSAAQSSVPNGGQ